MLSIQSLSVSVICGRPGLALASSIREFEQGARIPYTCANGDMKRDFYVDKIYLGFVDYIVPSLDGWL
jgi:hypothetical protein